MLLLRIRKPADRLDVLPRSPSSEYSAWPITEAASLASKLSGMLSVRGQGDALQSPEPAHWLSMPRPPRSRVQFKPVADHLAGQHIARSMRGSVAGQDANLVSVIGKRSRIEAVDLVGQPFLERPPYMLTIPRRYRS